MAAGVLQLSAFDLAEPMAQPTVASQPQHQNTTPCCLWPIESSLKAQFGKRPQRIVFHASAHFRAVTASLDVPYSPRYKEAYGTTHHLTEQSRLYRRDTIKPDRPSECFFWSLLVTIGVDPRDAYDHCTPLRKQVITRLAKHKDVIKSFYPLREADEYLLRVATAAYPVSPPEILMAATLLHSSIIIYDADAGEWLYFPQLRNPVSKLPRSDGCLTLLKIDGHFRPVVTWSNAQPPSSSTPLANPGSRGVFCDVTLDVQTPIPKSASLNGPILDDTIPSHSIVGNTDLLSTDAASKRVIAGHSLAQSSNPLARQVSTAASSSAHAPTADRVAPERRASPAVDATANNDDAWDVTRRSPSPEHKRQRKNPAKVDYVIPNWVSLMDKVLPETEEFTALAQQEAEEFFGPRALLDTDPYKDALRTFTGVADKMLEGTDADSFRAASTVLIRSTQALVLKVNQLQKTLDIQASNTAVKLRTMDKRMDTLPTVKVFNMSLSGKIKKLEVHIPGQRKPVDLVKCSSTYRPKYGQEFGDRLRSSCRTTISRIVLP